jgi:hypothetical protein
MPRCKAKLDELIDWYEAFKPDAGHEIRVSVKRRTAMKFAKPKERGGPLFYRGRLITPKPPRPKD